MFAAAFLVPSQAFAQAQSSFEPINFELRTELSSEQTSEVNAGVETDRPQKPPPRTGLRLGSFNADISLEVGLATDGHSMSKDIGGNVDIRSQWSRHELRLQTGLEINSDEKLDMTAWSTDLRLSGRRDISHRTNVTGAFSVTHSVADDSQDQTQYNFSAGLDVQPGPVSLSLRGALDLQYVGDAVAGEESSDNHKQLTVGLRASYNPDSIISPFIDIEVSHQNTARLSGFDGDARRIQAVTGLRLDRGEKFTAEIAMGIGFIKAEDTRRKEIRAYLWSASLVWSPIRLTTITATAAGRLDFSETTDLGNLVMASGLRGTKVSLRGERSFNSDLDGFAEISYDRSSYVSIDRVDHDFQFSAGLTYKLTPDSRVVAQFTHTGSFSSGASQNIANEHDDTVSLRYQYSY
ncbi:MAG: outer membrane beta-barrel protein [Rhizobiales bacterium]|nr:outer membrane beta-barrel protein [Hyphomicrobiales bacterium]